MNNLLILSAFRNASHPQIDRWVDQVVAVMSVLRPGDARAVAVEGDSTDNTAGRLVNTFRKSAPRLQDHFYVANAEHGGPRFGSVEDPRRMKALSFVLNRAMEQAVTRDDFVLWAESDLIWSVDTVFGLLDRMVYYGPGIDILAPLTMAGEHFYDVWGFRKGGSRFAPFPPYHRDLNSTGLTEVDSVGSFLMMRGEVARNTRVTDDNALVGWCEKARELGYHIWVDPDPKIRVQHPT